MPDPRPCPLCGSLEVTERREAGLDRLDGQPYTVVRCSSCGLRYTRPLPTEAELVALYKDEYYEDRGQRLLSINTLRALWRRLLIGERRAALLGRPPGRALDLGCGDGDFLLSLKRHGWEVHGMDFSAAARRIARSRGMTVHDGDLLSARFPDDHFDVVTLWHVLEHLPEPPPILAEVRRILRPDGYLVVEVPNSACLTYRLADWRWVQLDVPRHLQHFTPGTLRQMLAQSGFDPINRRDFHQVDFGLTFLSLVYALGLIGRPRRPQYFISDLAEASPATKALVVALAPALFGLCFLYSTVATAVTGNGESLTVTARKR